MVKSNQRSIAGHSCWIVALLSVACFSTVVPNDFCDDGVPIVQRNAKVTGEGGWWSIWTTDYWSEAKEATPNRDLLYRPMALASYRLVYAVAGDRAWAHHLVNIALHALVAVLLVRLCAAIGTSETVGLTAGVFFAVMPIHTDVLNNVVGRADLLAAAGVGAALLCHRDRRSGGPGKVWLGSIAAGLCAFVAMGAKESGVTAVALVALFDWLWRRKDRAGRSVPGGAVVRSVAAASYMLIPTAAYLVLRWYALEGRWHQTPALTKTVNVLVDAPTWQHALGVVQLWGMYWGKMLWPRVLAVGYSINAIRLATSVWDGQVLLGAATGLGMIVFSVWSWRRGRRFVAVASVAALVAYAPTSNSLVLIQVFFAERIWYLPSLFVAIVVAAAVEPLLRRRWVALLGVLLVAVMMGRCWMRSLQWRNNGTLYAAAQHDLPDAVQARYALGQWLVTRDDPEAIARGVGLLHGALSIDPGFTDAQRVIGNGYYLLGDYIRAVKHLQIADMQVPGHQDTKSLLDLASRALSEVNEAGLRRAIDAARAAPEDPTAELALIRLLRDLGRLDEALARFKDAESRFAQDRSWQHEYAVTLVLKDQRDEAIARYRQCLALGDDDPMVLLELAMLLLERREGNDLDEAWALSERAAELAPGASAVLHCQAELLAGRGDLVGAQRLLRRAIEVLPEGSAQWVMLRNRLKTLGG
ncbi:MAG: tetratricopeptide repeat protein [Phycisphaerae bacterium]